MANPTTETEKPKGLTFVAQPVLTQEIVLSILKNLTRGLSLDQMKVIQRVETRIKKSGLPEK